MPDVFHVGAYLVCPACFQYALYEGCIAEPFQYPVVGNGSLSYSAVGVEYFHAQAVLGVAPYIALYASFVFGNVAPYQCVVAAVCGLVEELFAEHALCFGCLGDNEESGRVFVYAVHQSYFRVIGVEILDVAHVPCHGIDERPRKVACPWVYYHSGPLVYHH